MFSGRRGKLLIWTPNGLNASQTALVKAPGTELGLPSPIPLVPKGVCGQGVLAYETLMFGTSAAVASL